MIAAAEAGTESAVKPSGRLSVSGKRPDPIHGEEVSRFVAKFTKRVLSDTGHPATITQRTFDLDARDRDEARQLAKRRFCDLEGVED
jgi:hypothetical protein